MKIRCSWCGKDMGEKEPLDSEEVSHGICEPCLERLLRGEHERDIEDKDIYQAT